MVMDILDIMESMRKADAKSITLLKEDSLKAQFKEEQKELNKSVLTPKQKYLRSLRGFN